LQPPNLPRQSASQPAGQVPAPFQTPPTHNSFGVVPPGAIPGGISIDSLNNDIHGLIVATKAEFAQSPDDASIRTRLKALLDLQSILQGQNLPQDQLALVKNQVAELAVKIRVPSMQRPTPPSAPVPQYQPPPAASVVPPQVSATPQAPVTIDALLGKGALAALLNRQPSTPQISTPTIPFTGVAIRSPPPQRVELPNMIAPTPPPPLVAAPPAPAMDPLALLAGLRQAGILPAAPPATVSGQKPFIPGLPVPLTAPPPVALPPVIANALAASKAAAAAASAPPRQPLLDVRDTVLNSATLKQQ
jgi:pre-mRNA cleavage complex 2 protein Pcf11